MVHLPDKNFDNCYKSQIDRFMSAILGHENEKKIKFLYNETNKYGYDIFGFNPEAFKYAIAIGYFFYKYYFRVEVFGIDNIPAKGKLLIVANHSGQIPIDGAMLIATKIFEGNNPRLLRSVYEKWAPTIPFIGTFFSRAGQVVGTPENAKLLLERQQALIVFPEGTKGISKPFSQKYKLQEFGLGFMRLALETKTPIVPVAIIGAEEQYPFCHNFKKFAQFFNTPTFPLNPFMFIPFVGILPLPTKYRIYFGSPLHFEGDHDEPDEVIQNKVQQVKNCIQNMMDNGVKERASIFW